VRSLPSPPPPPKKTQHDKPKPWDHDGIDHWQPVPACTAEDNPSGMLEESSFATLFPRYRERYLREAWPAVTRALKERGVACELNLVEGTMTVRTTRKTYDPYAVVRARDLIKLLARSVPAPQALKLLADDALQCDVIKIGGLVRSKPRFVKRRARLLGPGGSTLKALELLTGCYVLVQGNTVAAMGPFKGLKACRRVVEDCLRNAVHPIYHVKALMIRRELAKDPAMAGESWDRFLPKFKAKNVKRRKPLKVRDRKAAEDTPFPPAPVPSKADLQIESGEYFLSGRQRRERAEAAAAEQQERRAGEARARRDAAFVAPREEDEGGGGGGGGEGARRAQQQQQPRSQQQQAGGDVRALAASLKDKAGRDKAAARPASAAPTARGEALAAYLSPAAAEAAGFGGGGGASEEKKKKKKEKKEEEGKEGGGGDGGGSGSGKKRRRRREGGGASE